MTTLTVRPMQLEETDFLIDHFLSASAEYLETLGVDPTRLPERSKWQQYYVNEYALPLQQRQSYMILWQLNGLPLGFSSVDKLKFGVEAYMHLFIVAPLSRQSGYGAECVRQSVEIYFRELQLQRLWCEPNAFNVAPNRALQRAGFRYVKTHMTVPGLANFHQAVTRWVLDRSSR